MSPDRDFQCFNVVSLLNETGVFSCVVCHLFQLEDIKRALNNPHTVKHIKLTSGKTGSAPTGSHVTEKGNDMTGRGKQPDRVQSQACSVM